MRFILILVSSALFFELCSCCPRQSTQSVSNKWSEKLRITDGCLCTFLMWHGNDDFEVHTCLSFDAQTEVDLRCFGNLRNGSSLSCSTNADQDCQYFKDYVARFITCAYPILHPLSFPEIHYNETLCLFMLMYSQFTLTGNLKMLG